MKRRPIKITFSPVHENCDDKKWYPTETAALEAAEQGMFDHMSLDLGVYRCHICGNWHLTQLNKGEE